MNTTARKITSLLLTLALLLALVLVTPLVAQSESGACSHQHGEDCAYIAGVECSHQHDEACGWNEDSQSGCAHECGEGCGYIAAAACDHEHDADCGGLPVIEQPKQQPTQPTPPTQQPMQPAAGAFQGITPALIPVGGTFTADTTEGVTVTYKVITEPSGGSNGTAQVGAGVGNGAAISSTYTGTVTIPAVVNDGTDSYDVVEIADDAFRICQLTRIVIPNSVTKIGGAAFQQSKLSGTLVIPDSMTSIGQRAFGSCDGLTTVSLPAGLSVASVVDTFSNCTNLTAFTVSGAGASLKAVGGVLFSGDGTILAAYPSGKTGASYTVPHGTATIQLYAFYSNANLQSITVPATVTSVASYVFNAPNLATVTFLGDTPPTFSDTGIFHSSNPVNVIVPLGKVGAYTTAMGAAKTANVTVQSPPPSPVTINISTLNAANPNNSGNTAESQWTYDDTRQVLKLTSADGEYTLTGTNTALSVSVDTTATNANVTLDSVSITSNAEGWQGFSVVADGCTINLTGANTLTTNSGIIYNQAALSVSGASVSSVTITSSTSGSLTTTGTKENDKGIELTNLTNANINISGDAAVTAMSYASGMSDGILICDGTTIHVGQNAELFVNAATGIRGNMSATSYTLNSDSLSTNILSVQGSGMSIPTGTITLGGSGAITVTGGTNGAVINATSVKMGDNVTLKMYNNSSIQRTNAFEKANAASTHLWKLGGSITLASGNLGDASITVTVAAGTNGTIEREAAQPGPKNYMIQDAPGNLITTFSWQQWIDSPSNHVLADGDTITITATGSPASQVNFAFPGAGSVTGVAGTTYDDVRITAGGNLTIDYLSISSGEANGTIQFTGANAALTVNGPCEITNTLLNYGYGIMCSGAAFTINEGVSGGSLATSGAQYGIYPSGSGSFTMTIGGAVTVNASGGASGIFANRTGTFTITNNSSQTATFTGTGVLGDGINLVVGDLVINGSGAISATGKSYGSGISFSVGQDVTATFALNGGATFTGGDSGQGLSKIVGNLIIANNGTGSVTIAGSGSSGHAIQTGGNLTLAGTGAFIVQGTGAGAGIYASSASAQTITFDRNVATTIAGGATGNGVYKSTVGALNINNNGSGTVTLTGNGTTGIICGGNLAIGGTGSGAINIQGGGNGHGISLGMNSAALNVSNTGGVTATGGPGGYGLSTNSAATVTVASGATLTAIGGTSNSHGIGSSGAGWNLTLAGAGTINANGSGGSGCGIVMNDNQLTLADTITVNAKGTGSGLGLKLTHAVGKVVFTGAGQTLTVNSKSAGGNYIQLSMPATGYTWDITGDGRYDLSDANSQDATWYMGAGSPTEQTATIKLAAAGGTASDYTINGTGHTWAETDTINLVDGDVMTILAGTSQPAGATSISVANSANVTINGNGQMMTNIQIWAELSGTLTLNNLRITAPTGAYYGLRKTSDEDIILVGENEINGNFSHGAVSTGSSTLNFSSTTGGTLVIGNSGDGALRGSPNISGNASVIAKTGVSLSSGALSIGPNASLTATASGTSYVINGVGGTRTINNQGTLIIGNGTTGGPGIAYFTGLTINNSGTMSITGNANYAAISEAIPSGSANVGIVNSGSLTITSGTGKKAIETAGTIDLRLTGSGSYTITNNSASADSDISFTALPSGYKWSLTGSDAGVAFAATNETSDPMWLYIPASKKAVVTLAAASGGGNVCEIGSQGYATLADALAAVPSGTAGSATVIKLLDNITTAGEVTISSKKITFDLNGKNLVFSTSDTSQTALTLKNSIISYVDATGTGSFIVKTTANSNTALEIIGGSVALTGVKMNGGSGLGIDASNNAAVTLNGDLFCDPSGGGDGIYLWSGSSLNMTGDINMLCDNGSQMIGLLMSEDGYYTKAEITGNINVSSGGGYAVGVMTDEESDFTITGDINVYCESGIARGIYCWYLSDVMVIGNVTAESGDDDAYGIYDRSESTIYVTGNVTASNSSNNAVGISVSESEVTVDGIISADIYIQFDGTDCDEGDLNFLTTSTNPGYLEYTDNISYVWVKIQSGNVCKNTTTNAEFTTFKAAVDAAASGQTIEMLANYTETTPIVIDGKTVNLDVSNYTLNLNAATTGGLLEVVNGGKLIQTTGGTGKFNITGGESGIFANGANSVVTIRGNVEGGLEGVYADVGAVVTITGGVAGGNHGAHAEGGAKVTVIGNVTAIGTGAFADTDAEITITGNITADNMGAEARDGAIITITGNIKATNDIGYGVYVEDGAQIIINGTITAMNYIDFDGTVFTATDNEATSTKMGYLEYTDGISTVWVLDSSNVCRIVGGSYYPTFKAAVDAAASGDTVQMLQNYTETQRIEVDGKTVNLDVGNYTLTLKTSGTALMVENDGKLLCVSAGTGRFNITGKDFAVYAREGAEVIINGDVESTALSSNGVYANDENTEVTITGKVTSASFGVYAQHGAQVTVNGDIEANDTGAYAKGTGNYTGVGSQIIITGDVYGTYLGVRADNGAKITVQGDVEGDKDIGVYAYNTDEIGNASEVEVTGDVKGDNYGVYAEYGAQVTINGNTEGGVAGVYANSGAEVTVNGTVIGRAAYIYIGETLFNYADYAPTTTKAGYLTYTDGESTVWVLDSAAFVAVTGISGVPTSVTAGTPLTLTGTVNPTNASFKTIVWSVKSADATGATISGNILSTTAAGTVTVTATITNGKAVGTDYTQDFDIVVSAAVSNNRTVSYDANGGTGSMTPDTITSGNSYTIKANAFTRSGYTFSGWNTAGNGNGTAYAARAMIRNVTTNITLYAQWSRSGGGGSGGSSAPLQTITPTAVPLAASISFPAFIKGFTDNTFRSDALMTREQFVAILFRLNGGYSSTPADKNKPSFKDVAPVRWSYEAIEWAKGEDIIAADKDGNFHPADALTRAEMAVMLVKAEGWTEMAENAFNDLANHKDREDILRAVKAGVFTGYPDGSFKPDGNTSRAEAVTALIRYLLGQEPTDNMWKNLKLSFTDVSVSHWSYKYITLAVWGYTGTVE